MGAPARPGAVAGGRIWAWALAAGVSALLAVLLLFRGTATLRPGDAVPTPAPATTPRSTLQLMALGGAAGDPALSEDVALFDPATLFLPTRWNSSYVAKSVGEPASAFAGYPPKLVFAATAPALARPILPVPTSAAEGLADDPPGAPLLGFGRADGAVAALAPRGAFVEVREAASGRPVMDEALAAAVAPPEALWQPMEFLAAVDRAGLVGPLVATVSSGALPVDAYFRRYLAETLRIGARLSPGFYRISVGP